MVNKIVVFDFDETIGDFIQLKVFWESIKHILNYTDNDIEKLNNILDLYPKYFRPKILNILMFLLKIKDDKLCKYIMIYSNNPNKIWVQQVCNYINKKLKRKVFNKIICAFKSKGKIIEPSRSTNKKNIDDLLQCAKLPLNTKICFIDDQYYNLMDTDNVYYINIKPYTYSQNNDIMIDSYYKKYENSINFSQDIFKKGMLDIMNEFDYKFSNKDMVEHSVDIAISKKLMEYIKIYFIKVKRNKTRKIKKE